MFITGTNTEVGKTYVAAQIARQLAQSGRAVGVYKPAASGCAPPGPMPTSDDARQLWEAAGEPGALARVCPQRFAAPLAPHLAARLEGRQVEDSLLVSGIGYWADRCEIVVVEGAGGYLSPLSDRLLVADVALRLGYPLVIVAANALGVINQVLQTVWVARTYGGGLPVAGVVLNDGPAPTDASGQRNEQELVRISPAPVLARVRSGQSLPAAIDWWSLAHTDAARAGLPPSPGES